MDTGSRDYLMTIEEKARTIIDAGNFYVNDNELTHELAWEVVKLHKKLKELELFMADNDVPYIHRKAIIGFFQF
jgi:hypothetical protein